MATLTDLVGSLRESLTWQEQALCAQGDASLWFPPRSGAREAAAAVTVCCRCPVVDECLTYAMECEDLDRFHYGIWGGLTPRQRERLARARVTAVAS